MVNASDNNVVGTLSDIKITCPSYILFADETGSSTNMKNDKTGNRRVITETRYNGTKEAITIDLQYTTISFSAATGEPVL
jgi:hypothetical protein